MEKGTMGKFVKNLKVLIPLLIICVVASALLGAFNRITAGPISENAEKTAQETRLKLIPEAGVFADINDKSDDKILSCHEALGSNGETLGFVVVCSATGYKPGIEVTVGMDKDCRLIGISVGGTNFNETAGLGAKAKDKEFTDPFAGKLSPVKAGDDPDHGVDAISGATKTTNGVLSAVNQAVRYVQVLKGIVEDVDTSIPEGAVTYTASRKGFAGPVAVTVSFDGNGAINGIVIGDDQFAETEGFGAAALEPSFAAQFIGKVPPLTLEGIDAISGATYTSTAVVESINDDFAQFNGEAPAAETVSEPETASIPEGTYTAAHQGFVGPVAVNVSFDSNGAIQSLTIGGDKFVETKGFGAAALEPAFAEQFIGKVPPLAVSDIDAISGATYTTTAVVDGINDAYEQYAKAGAPGEAAAPEADGTYSAAHQGFVGPVAVKVSFDSNGAIQSLTIGDDKFVETKGFGAAALEPAFAEQFIGKVPPLALSDIDAISGATYTTTAVVDGINDAYEQYAKAGAPGEAAAPEADGTYTAAHQGFVGPVAVKVSFDSNGAIQSLTIGDDKFVETKGFGAAALEPAFAEQFIGKVPPLAVSDIDAISGATYTTTAVVDGINDAYEQFAKAGAPGEAAAPEADGTYSAAYQGFVGPVAVKVSFDGNGAIQSLTIGDDRFVETKGFGAAALEPAFAEQFIGKVPPLALSDIDAISGATYTTTAVVDGINDAYEQYAKAGAPGETAAPEADGTYSAAHQGFVGPVAVKVSFDANGAIQSLTIGDDKFVETKGFGAAALEPAFAEQFIGKVPPLAVSDIDAISGATKTTNAVVEAINLAFAEFTK